MPEISASKYLVNASWKDVPHIDEKTQAELLAATPPYLRDARSKGEPSLGAGAIYPVELSEVLVDPFQIPPHWPRCYALDVGWNRTAARLRFPAKAALARGKPSNGLYLCP